MKIARKLYMILLILYIIIYKIYLVSINEIFQYIINPLIIMFLALFGYILFYVKNIKYYQYKKIINYDIVISALIYIFFYYSLGFFQIYANNPYSKTINGIIINLFSILFVLFLKEIIRGILINFYSNKKIYNMILLFLIFFIYDLDIKYIFNLSNFLANWFLIFGKIIIPALSLNLFSMYICKNGGIFQSAIYRIILMFPMLVMPIVPKYEFIIPMLFDTLIPLFTYIIIRNNIKKNKKQFKYDVINPKKWISTFLIAILIVMFAVGAFNIKPVVILTGSMEPNIYAGDLVIIQKCQIDNIEIGDIIQYKTKNYTVVHRVIKIFKNNNKIEIITKGDNNLKQDNIIITNDNLIGCFKYRIPYIGYPAYFIRNLINTNDIEIETGS